jgi:DNA repair protein RecN (Recombination protein N)
MLKKLNISQFVIIDEVNLDFKNGLTTLTGETGAGKSIMLDALGLILGDAGDAEMVRLGADQATIEAHLEMQNEHPTWAILKKHGLDIPPPVFRMRRVLTRDGLNESYINDQSVPLEVMQELGAVMIEIHGQFANTNITNPIYQRDMLDSFGGYKDLLKNTASAWGTMRALEKALEEEKKFMANAAAERVELTALVAEMKLLKAKPGEYEQMEADQKELTRQKLVGETLQSVQAQMVAGSGAERSLSGASRIIEKQKSLDTEVLEPLADKVNKALEYAREATSELFNLMPRYEVDMERLHAIEDRIEKFKKLAAKKNAEPRTLPDLFTTLDARLKRILQAQEMIKELEDKVMSARGDYLKNSQALSEVRSKAAVDLSIAITNEFKPLKLGSAEFLVEVSELPSNEWGPTGINEVVYTARTNLGMPFSTIAKTASGGELARMILALKVILQSVQVTTTLIFDEVDTGIGGSAAAAVGERIAKLADNTQVLVITHSPQVASRGDQHLNVSKTSDGQKTITHVQTLSMEEREDEIARMLAGDTITPEAKANAVSLISEASEAAKIRRGQQAA